MGKHPQANSDQFNAETVLQVMPIRKFDPDEWQLHMNWFHIGSSRSPEQVPL
jgi:hypothetical protein